MYKSGYLGFLKPGGRRVYKCFLKTILEDIMRPFLVPLIPRGDPFHACFVTCMQWIPQIRLWWYDCRPLDSHHGNREFFEPHIYSSIGGTRTRDRVFVSFHCTFCRGYQARLEHPTEIHVAFNRLSHSSETLVKSNLLRLPAVTQCKK